jgi:HAD superfamily hydrolase (TIGR01459 family)
MNSAKHGGTVSQINGLGEISDRYDVVLCDIWGVLHDGVYSFPQASQALASFRQGGGVVVLITNAPRPSALVHRQLLKLGIPRNAFDAIVTSGDVTIGLVEERIADPVLHIGPARDFGLFVSAAAASGRQPTLASLEEARYALCTGLRKDDTETPDDYEAELRVMAARLMPMICANPDVVIHRGADLVYCAGALARRYEDIGGSVIYAGKPHPPIYRRALALAEHTCGRAIDRRRVLAIGDGMVTDIAGAAGAGLDALLVTAGIHRDCLHPQTLDSPADPTEIRRLCIQFALWPVAAISSLRN